MILKYASLKGVLFENISVFQYQLHVMWILEM
jgi:hypothetical protein